MLFPNNCRPCSLHAAADTEKKFLPTYLMMNLRVACPSKAISLPGQKQLKKQRQEIILGVVRQSLKQKATKMSFISGVQFRAILQ